ncbi:MAG: ABC transporter ATP-binding protein [Clostridia bacterium]|nr:ABC transporter ATP-binding protein [Clostridia bacterium]
MDTLRWLSKYFKKYSILLIITIILTFGYVAFNYVHPIIIGKIVDLIQNMVETASFQIDKNQLLIYSAVILGAIIGKEACFYIKGCINEHISQNIVMQIRCELFARLEALDCRFFEKNKTGDILSRLTSDIDSVKAVLTGTVPQIVQSLSFFVIGFGIVISVSPILAIALFAVSPLVAYFAIVLGKKLKPTFIGQREAISELNSVAQENIDGNKVVKAYAREEFETEKFQKSNENYYNKHMHFVYTWVKYYPRLTFSVNLTNVVFILVGGYLTLTGHATVGQYATVNGILWCIVSPMQLLGTLLNQIQQASASTIKLRKLYDATPDIRNHKVLKRDTAIEGKITFKNVTFSYEKDRVLKSINFTANPGDTVAIIGPTGSGKSSIVNLISRFYDPREGTVYIDDINIKNIDLNTVRKSVAIAMQDIFLFSDTIANNIAYGIPTATREDIIKVAKDADAHEFISKLPDGYDTIVGERGVGLSGGQRQRISLARALLKNPSILILDDTTSAVDMETEFSIQQTLENNYKNKTTIIIAHRISSVKNADLILVMNGGHLIEWGNHNQLLNQNGYYKHVYDSQFGDFTNTGTIDVDYPNFNSFKMGGTK